MNLRSEVYQLRDEISGDIEHGECFYDLESLNELCEKLDKMKELSLKLYDENRAER
jgi:hypothetical protein